MLVAVLVVQEHAFLRQLLHGESPDLPLDPSRTYHCLVSDISEPAVAARLEVALDGLCGFVDGRLAAVLLRRIDWI